MNWQSMPPPPVAEQTEGRLGGRVMRRPLHFLWLLDTSGSMAADGKIRALDVAVREVLPILAEAAASNPGVELLVRAMAFGSTLRPIIEVPTPIADVRWPGISVEERGLTELGPALAWVAGEVRQMGAAGRGFAPAIILVSDGQPTDIQQPTFAQGMEMLRREPWGENAVRLSVAIGGDANDAVLRAFQAPSTEQPLHADNPEQLSEAIRFVSVAAVQASSMGKYHAPTLVDGNHPPTNDNSMIW